MFMIKERAKCGVIWSTVKLPTSVTFCPFRRPPDRDSRNYNWWPSCVCTSENLTTSMKVFIAFKIEILIFIWFFFYIANEGMWIILWVPCQCCLNQVQRDSIFKTCQLLKYKYIKMRFINLMLHINLSK